MIPGPEMIIACPNCEGLARFTTLRSGNTFGARQWTDGKRECPMWPDPPVVVRCDHCAECYWLTRAKRVGTVGRSSPPDASWDAAEEIQEPTAEEYYRAIERGLATGPVEERNLRILAWWRSNDACRNTLSEIPGHIPSASGAFRENLLALDPLLIQADLNDCLMRAEILRELGEFDSAKQVLDRLDSAEVATVAGQLRSLCDRGDRCVRELQM